MKSDDEIRLMQDAVRACNEALHLMQQSMRDGITEQQLWSVLHRENIASGGEWIETRLLVSGQRTNPWYQECGESVVKDGELVAFDTDMVGRHGFTVDFSRTWLCGSGDANDEQKLLYTMAYCQVQHNIRLVKAGVSFKTFVEKKNVLFLSCNS